MSPQEPHKWVKVVERLEALGEIDQALQKVLYPVMALAEKEAKDLDVGVAPWYYWRAAVLHNARGERAQAEAVLRRFAAQPRHAPGKRTQTLLARVARLDRRQVA